MKNLGAILILIMCLFSMNAMAKERNRADAKLPTRIIDNKTYYVLTSADDLLTFSDLVIMYQEYEINAILDADIDMTDADWIPIGSYSGTFDGQMHTIENLKINSEEYSNNVGLFGDITNKALITRVIIKNAEVVGEETVSILCGASDGGHISRCAVTGGKITAITDYAAPICASAQNKSIIRDCYSMSVTIDSKNRGAGVVGELSDGSSVVSCFAYTNTLKCKNFGGICALVNNSTLDHSYTDAQPLINTDNNAQIIKSECVAIDKFSNGYVTYNLNKGVCDGTQTWYQLLGSDALPTWTASDNNVVYKHICDKSPDFTNHATINGFCGECGGYEQPPLNNGWYEISNAGQMVWFCKQTKEDAKGRLMNDLVFNEDLLDVDGNVKKPVDGLIKWDCVKVIDGGAFDGCNHSISGLYCEGQNASLFLKLKNASFIRDLSVIDSYYEVSESDDVYGAGIVIEVVNNPDISKCNFSGTIKYSGKPWKVTCGGIAARLESEAWDVHASINNCVATGYIRGSDHRGGIFGIHVGGNVEYIHMMNCSYSTSLGNFACLNNGFNGENTKVFTKEQALSGEMTYTLNNGPAGPYRQVIGKDFGPSVKNNPDAIVYRGEECTGKFYYSNEKPSGLRHPFDERGLCKNCGTGTEAPLNNGWYEISNAGQMVWFCKQTKEDAKGRLMNDLVFNEDLLDVDGNVKKPVDGLIKWDCVKVIDGGAFEGCNHSISGLYCEGQNASLFLKLKNASFIRDLSVIDSYYEVSKSGGLYGAGIVIEVVNNPDISKCNFSGTIKYSGQDHAAYCGGIAAKLISEAGDIYAYINNCVATGYIRGSNYTGGIFGINRGGNSEYLHMMNCSYSTSLSNCASINGFNGENTKVFTKEQALSGEMTYTLNNGSTGPYRQVIGKDLGPSFKNNPDAIVYRGEGCPDKFYYSNEKQSGPRHQFDERGLCKNCGAGTEAPLNNGWYEISNVGQMVWFCKQTKEDAKGRLMNDLVFNEDLLDVDGNVKKPVDGLIKWDCVKVIDGGAFEGCNHSISGLYCEGQNASLFLKLKNASLIRDLSVIDSYYEVSKSGGLCGAGIVVEVVNNPDISKCNFSGTIKYSGQAQVTCGGIAAKLNSEAGHIYAYINNCVATGYIRGSNNTNTGGIIGIYRGGNSEYIHMMNCSYSTSLGNYASCSGIIGENTKVFTKEQALSGEMTYTLNNGATGPYYQRIGKDLGPSFLHTHGSDVYQVNCGTKHKVFSNSNKAVHYRDEEFVTSTTYPGCMEKICDCGAFMDLKLHATEDPDHSGTYFTTFYDSKNSFNVEGAKAYTGSGIGSCLLVEETPGNNIAAGDGVMLKGDSQDVLLTKIDGVSRVNNNVLTGSDENVAAPANCYVLSHGEQKLGFYPYNASEELTAHKAYLTQPKQYKFITIAYDIATGIHDTENDEAGTDKPVIYSISGVRQNHLQRGINIVNGKKYVKM